MIARSWLVGVVLMLTLVTGCSGTGSSAPGADSPSPSVRSSATKVPSGDTNLPIDEGGPLVALPECQPAPPAIEADVPGLLLPKGAVVTEVEQQGPLVFVQGYVDQTPIQVRMFYQRADGLELFEIEDEIYEAEALFAGPEFRSYVKAQAQCQQGSLLVVYVGPDRGGQLPQLGGAG